MKNKRKVSKKKPDGLSWKQFWKQVTEETNRSMAIRDEAERIARRGVDESGKLYA